MRESKNNKDIYTMLPRFVSEAEIESLHEPENPLFLRMIKRPFERNGVRFKFEIVPACFPIENVGTTNFYPGAAEEEMENALRSLAVEENPNFDKSEGTLVFSLTEIRAELEEPDGGRSYSCEQVERSLAILCRTAYDLSHDGRHLSFNALDQILQKEMECEKYYQVQFSSLFLNRLELFEKCFGSETADEAVMRENQ